MMVKGKSVCFMWLRNLYTPTKEMCQVAVSKLHDDSIMPFGKYKGEKLGKIPDHYWLWFKEQDWASKYPDLLAYAKLCDED
jgi:uncharacterized protein (DUF3820 family)